MKFLLDQSLFNNDIFCTTWIIPHPKKQQRKLNKRKLNQINLNQRKLNKIKDKFNGIQVINFHNRLT